MKTPKSLRRVNKRYKLKKKALKHQKKFIDSKYAFPALVAGLGSGKTEGGVMRAFKKKWQNKKQDVAYYLPTYDLIFDIAWPRFIEYLDASKKKYKPNISRKIITVKGCGRFRFKSMDRPEKIIGYEVADSIVDELDTLKAIDAKKVWKNIVARNRQKKENGEENTIGVITTPEGFRFVHATWKEEENPGDNLREGYQLIHGSTYDNPYLPKGYIDTLKSLYPADILDAYLNGQFVNLEGMRIYTNFNRATHDCKDVIKNGDILHIGMDFNVNNMTAIIHKENEDGEPRACDEIAGVLDTPSMCDAIRLKFPTLQFPTIFVYPDASGKARKTNNASVSDISILEEAGFYVDAPQSNPAVKDRILAMNKAFMSAGKISYKINVSKCPVQVRALESQTYKDNGAPDKDGGFDHPNDAAGYYINRRYPVEGVKYGRIQSHMA